MTETEDRPARREAEKEIKRCVDNSIRNKIVDFPSPAVILEAKQEERRLAALKMGRK